MFRVLKLQTEILENILSESWQMEEQLSGPSIDRTVIIDFQVTSIQYVTPSKKQKRRRGSKSEFKDFVDQIFISSVQKGSSESSSELILQGYYKANGSWQGMPSVLEQDISIRRGIDQFTHEVQQNQLAQYSNVHEANQILSLFSRNLIAFDWDYDLNKLISHNSNLRFRDSVSAHQNKKF